MATPKRIFSGELENIRLRHPMFFAMDQKRFIKMVRHGNTYQLKLLPGILLPQVVIMEIELAFKLSLPFGGTGVIADAT